MPRKSIFLPISPRPPRLRTPPARPKGPRIFQIHKASTGWPVDPPPDFPGPGLVRAQVSRDEWWMYVAFAIAFDDPKRPLRAPYTGGRDWTYQVPALLSGQLIAREAGSSVIDFVLYLGPGAKYAVRLQSEMHTLNPFGRASQTIARDIFSASHLEGYDKVLDLYSQDFMWDETGQAAVMQARDAMRGDQNPNPISFGTARRVR